MLFLNPSRRKDGRFVNVNIGEFKILVATANANAFTIIKKKLYYNKVTLINTTNVGDTLKKY